MRSPGCRRLRKLRSGWGSSWCRRSRCPACTSTPKTCTSAATGSTSARSRPACERAQHERVTRAGEIVEKLRGEGFDLHLEDAVREAGDALSIGRPHIARAAGATGDLGPFFEEYLVPGAKAFVPRRWPTAEQAVETIKQGRWRRRRRPPLLGHLRADRGRRADPRPRRRRHRDLLPDAQQGADRAPARAMRRARPDPHRLLRLPRPDPQDLREVRRLRHLRPRRASGAIEERAGGLLALASRSGSAEYSSREAAQDFTGRRPVIGVGEETPGPFSGRDGSRRDQIPRLQVLDQLLRRLLGAFRFGVADDLGVLGSLVGV